MKSYRFSNGRIIARDSKGRFRNFTLKDFSIDSNLEYLICSKCGYGEKEKWIPLLKTGECPKCSNQEGHKEKEVPLSKRAEELINKIDELETKIGKDFINPMMFNKFGGELKKLRYELKEELKLCIEKSFLI